jgi:hypothetical protein
MSMMRFRRFIVEMREVFKKREGESDVVYHATQHDFDNFKPLSHFGTNRAARARVSTKWYRFPDGKKEAPHPNSKFNTFAARLKLGNVVHLDDLKHHTAKEYIDGLHKAGHLSDLEAKSHHNILWFKKNPEEQQQHVLGVLKEKGIDTIAYKNEYEHRGSQSYIITDPNQVRILHKTKGSKLNVTKGQIDNE